MDKVKTEIVEAVRKLGYKGEVEIATLSIGRLIVFVDGKHLGIYDLNRHTFVD